MNVGLRTDGRVERHDAAEPEQRRSYLPVTMPTDTPVG